MSKQQPIRDRVVEVITMRASELHDHPLHPHQHNDKQRQVLLADLRESGKSDVLKAYRGQAINPGKLTLIDGHLRKDLDDGEWKVAILDLDDAEAKRKLLTHNAIAQLVELEPSALDSLLREVSSGEEALQSLFAEMAADAGLYAEEKSGKGGDDFDVESVGTRAQPGDIWRLEPHTVACADSTNPDVLNAILCGNKPAMVFTDPPYGMNLNTDYSPISRQWKGQVPFAHSKKYESVIGDDEDYDPTFLLEYFSGCKEVFLWGGDYYANKLPRGGWYVWDKTAFHTQQVVGSEFELCWSKQGHKRQIVSVKWSGVMGLQSQDVKHRVHPTQKPLEVCSFFIEQYSSSGDLIADPFLGSGSTLIAASRLGRRVAGCELSPAYVDVILARWGAETGKIAELVERMEL